MLVAGAICFRSLSEFKYLALAQHSMTQPLKTVLYGRGYTGLKGLPVVIAIFREIKSKDQCWIEDANLNLTRFTLTSTVFMTM